MVIMTMIKWSYEMATMVEVSRGDCQQDDCSKVGVFCGGDNSRGGDCNVRMKLGWWRSRDGGGGDGVRHGERSDDNDSALWWVV